MDDRFWSKPEAWPKDPPGYVFLARGFDEIGRAMFGDRWRGETSSATTKSTYQLGETHQFTEDELRELDRDDDDEADNADDGMRLAVQREIEKQCLQGGLISAVRPIEGGNMIELDSAKWNADVFKHRFYRCQMSLESPFANSSCPATHWIFLSRESLDKFLVGQPYGALLTQVPKHISPYLKAMLVVTERMGITPDKQPKKGEVITEIRKAWAGKPLSKKLIDVMATLVREPESQLGRAKKKVIE